MKELYHIKKATLVVVADGNSFYNKTICQVLTGYELNVNGVQTGQQVIAKISQNSDVLLILNSSLPDMTYQELLRYIRDTICSIPVIFISEQEPANLMNEINKWGIRDIVVKDEHFLERLPGIVQRTLNTVDTEKKLMNIEAEKCRLEQQLIEAQRMETMGVLARDVVHDFNNLLTAIYGYSELALAEVEQGSTLHFKLEHVQRAADRASTLTRQLSMFSRKQKIKKKVLNLNRAVSGMLKIVRRMIRANIEIKTDFDPSLRKIEADIGHIEQVIMNLMINASDTMPEGGKLTIATKNISLTKKDCQLIHEASPGDYTCLSVSDTGTGIGRDALEQAFYPFFTTKNETSGSRLGLSIVYSIIKQHEGCLNIYTTPGVGTTYKIYLPSLAMTEVVNGNDPPLLEHLQGENEHILLVEDDPEIREWISITLNENGYKVTEARHAEEALNIFKKKKKHLKMVISDIILPGKSGLQLVKNLLALQANLKVLFCSGYSDECIKSEAIFNYKYQFLEKPFTMKQLLKAVKKEFKKAKTKSRC